MKKLGILVLALAVVAFCFTGCTVKSQLSGTKWKFKTFTIDGAEEAAESLTSVEGLSFAKDGTLYSGVGGTDIECGKWSASGNTLSFWYGREDWSGSCTVAIKNNVMTWSDISWSKAAQKLSHPMVVSSAITLEKVGKI